MQWHARCGPSADDSDQQTRSDRPLEKETSVSHNLDSTHLLTRRAFTLESALALLAGVTITVTGCGSSNPAAPTPVAADVSGAIGTNHGHTATVTGAQITAAGALSLNITGTATHPHTVALTGAQLQQIGSRQQVAVTSSTDAGHTHTVTFN
jgi:hypothetical protein